MSSASRDGTLFYVDVLKWKSSERAFLGRKSSSKSNASVAPLSLRIAAIWLHVMFLDPL